VQVPVVGFADGDAIRHYAFLIGPSPLTLEQPAT
jgi:hypothetical protein